MIRLHFRFTGRVQGVGFRATARSIAASLHLTGWVRNEPDGTVAAEVQGKPADLDRFLAELARALPRHIAAIDRSELPLREQESGLEIRR